MTHNKNALHLVILCVTSLFLAGCERDLDGLKPAQASTDPVVFRDDFGNGVDFHAFLFSKFDALEFDTEVKYAGSAGLKLTIPEPGDPSGTFAGGAFVSNGVRNLSGYNALTFYAKADRSASFNVVGLGNDNTGESRFTAEWGAVPLTTTWTKFVVPIPNPDRLTLERGLFFFAEGAEDNQGYTVWFDEIVFEKVTAISDPRPSMATRTVGAFVGEFIEPQDTKSIFNVGGTDQTINHMSGYFDYISSADSVAKTGSDGTIEIVGEGVATVTAKLGEVDAVGSVTLITNPSPETPAPAPVHPAGDVISLFSNAYDDVPVDSWHTVWSHNFSDFTEFKIQGNDVKAYTNLVFAGIEFATNTIDATGMTHLHLDIWLSRGTTLFKLKVVDFGEDGMYTTGVIPTDISEREISFTLSTDPPVKGGEWISMEIPLDDLMGENPGLVSRAHLAQLVISGTGNSAFLDNVYFHK